MARTFQGYPAGSAAHGAVAPQNARDPQWGSSQSPPPPPSARRALPAPPLAAEPAFSDGVGHYAAPAVLGDPNAPPFPEPLGEVASRPSLEMNPFKSPPFYRAWLERLKQLKKPPRELTIRAAIGLAALTIGWGIGAKPWASSSKGHASATLSRAAGSRAPLARSDAQRSAAVTNRRVAATAHAPEASRPTTQNVGSTKKPLTTQSKQRAQSASAPHSKSLHTQQHAHSTQPAVQHAGSR